MSDPADRQKSKSRRRFAEEAAAAEMVERYMAREMASLRAELDRMKDLFRLYGATPRPGQPLDTWIEEQHRKFTKVFPREGESNMEKPVKIYTKKYLKQQRKRVAEMMRKRASAGIAVNEPLRKAPPAIPESAELALAELKKAAECGDASLRRVRVERAQQQLGIEMVKAIQSRAPMRDPRMTFRF
jgi:hypothetical protein